MRKIFQFIIVVMVLAFSTSVIAKTHTIFQKDKTFMKKGSKIESISINTGDSVKFTNEDSVFHNIFSQSAINKFNLGAFGNGKSESVTFKKPGKARVECAIHPRMQLEVIVN